MTYFLILPVFSCALVLMSILTLVARFVAPLKPVFPFSWRVLLWSSVGFLLANGLWLLAMMAYSVLAQPIDQSTEYLVNFGYGVMLILGPVILSVVGFSVGAIVGVLLAFKSLRENLPRPA